MKRTKTKFRRTNYLPPNPDSNQKKIISLLIQMAVANKARDRELFKKLDKQLYGVQQLQIKLKNKKIIE